METNTKTTKGTYWPSEREDVIEAITAYCAGKKPLDLGSGDGRVIEWMREVGADNPCGIEYEDYATDIRGDMMEHDFSQYDVLFYYILGVNYLDENDLYLKILREFRGILILNLGVNYEITGKLTLGENYTVIGKCRIYNLGDR